MLEAYEIGHMTTGLVNPKVTMKQHDRGSTLSLNMFLSENVVTEPRSHKITLSTIPGAVEGAISHDWAEAQTVWACVDALYAYGINLFVIRGHDYSAWVLFKVIPY